MHMKTLTLPRWEKQGKVYVQCGTIETPCYGVVGGWAVTKNLDKNVSPRTYSVTHVATGVKIVDVNSKVLGLDIADAANKARPEQANTWEDITNPSVLKKSSLLLKQTVDAYLAYHAYSDTEYKARRMKK
jgi:hypothetical protein